jgi:hypothetical protein
MSRARAAVIVIGAAALAGCPDEPARSPDDVPGASATYTPPPPNTQDPQPGSFVHGKPVPIGSAPPASSAPVSAGPILVDIAVVDAIIGPGKIDRIQWDGTDAVSPEIWRDLNSAIKAKDPYAAVLSFLGKPAVAKLDKPEPVGSADLQGDARGVKRVPLEMLPGGQRSTFTPQWVTARWTRVPLTRDVRIRVNVLDQDEIVSDLIGVCEIPNDALAKALEKGGGHRLQVSEQTRGQILFLGITVTPSR